MFDSWKSKVSSQIKGAGMKIKSGFKHIKTSLKKTKRPRGIILALLVILVGLNSAFWIFRASHNGFSWGKKPQLRQWEVDMNEKVPEQSQKQQDKADTDNEVKSKDRSIESLNSSSESLTETSENTSEATKSSQAFTEKENMGEQIYVETDDVVSATAQLSTMAMPVIGKTITNFAVDTLTYSKTLEQWGCHHGIDISNELGTPVKAAIDGTVVDVKKDDPKLGVVVVIDHGADIKTVYGNLASEKLVEKGMNVQKGQVIGSVGKTAPFEIEDPPHLHFEVRRGEDSIDPSQFLPKLK